MDVMCLTLFLSIISLPSAILSSNSVSPCKMSDLTCIMKTINAALPQILNKLLELSVTNSGSEFSEITDGSLSILKFAFSNTTVSGHEKCIISNLTFNDITAVYCDIICPELKVSGQYVMKGSIMMLPIRGNGDYKINIGKFFVAFDTKMEKIKGSNGKTHLFIKNIKVKSKPLAPITFDFKNLFNGQKDLSDAIHKFAQENWLKIAELIQYPFWYTTLTKVASYINKYLENIAMDDLLN